MGRLNETARWKRCVPRTRLSIYAQASINWAAANSRHTMILHIQTILIWRRLSMFDISLEQPEIHSPAVARDVVMFVRIGPARVAKPHMGHAIFFVQKKAHTRFQPVFLRDGNPDFKLGVRNTSGYYRAPIVFRAEPEFVFRSFDRVSRRSLCPPGVETGRR